MVARIRFNVQTFRSPSGSYQTFFPFSRRFAQSARAGRIRRWRRDRTPGRKEYGRTRTFTLQPQSGRHVIFVHTPPSFCSLHFEYRRGERTAVRLEWRNEKGWAREGVEGKRERKSDYVIASLYVTRALCKHFSTGDVVVVSASRTRRVTRAHRKRVFRYPIKHLLVLLPAPMG